MKHIRVKGKTEKQSAKDAVEELMDRRPDHAVQIFPEPRKNLSGDGSRTDRNLPWRVDYAIDFGEQGYNRVDYFRSKFRATVAIGKFLKDFEYEHGEGMALEYLKVYLTKQRLTDI